MTQRSYIVTQWLVNIELIDFMSVHKEYYGDILVPSNLFFNLVI